MLLDAAIHAEVHQEAPEVFRAVDSFCERVDPTRPTDAQSGTNLVTGLAKVMSGCCCAVRSPDKHAQYAVERCPAGTVRHER